MNNKNKTTNVNFDSIEKLDKLADKLDKFYTKESIAKKCINQINLNNFDFVIEPSAGNGSFSKNLIHKNVSSMDIAPENKKIIKMDWFKYEVPKKYKNVVVIGNPPFGKKNKLSVNFIKHAAKYKNVKTIAFILPNVFKKHTLQKNIPNDFNIIKIYDLGNNAFLFKGENYHVPCSFFVLERNSKQKDLRQKQLKENNYFSFSNKENYDFFIFGAAPHKIIKTPNKNNRGYYIKAKVHTKTLKEKWNKINWKGHSSASGGVSWLTKTDILENFNKIIL